MQITPKVSVIMGCYNCVRTVEAAVHSILAQTYGNIEFIICDDCSTDGTLDVLKKLKEKDNRIVILTNKKNLKLAATLNRCLDFAKGEFIARMDADDSCAPTRFEEQVNYLLLNPNIDCVGTNMYIHNEYCCPQERKFPEYPDKFTFLRINPFAHPTIMMRKSAYVKLKGYFVSNLSARCEDAELWFRFFAAGMKGYNIQRPLYHYKEQREDYKKRSLQTAINATIIRFKGFQLLNYPFWCYSFCIKPLISACIPDKFVILYHKIKDSSK